MQLEALFCEDFFKVSILPWEALLTQKQFGNSQVNVPSITYFIS